MGQGILMNNVGGGMDLKFNKFVSSGGSTQAKCYFNESTFKLEGKEYLVCKIDIYGANVETPYFRSDLFIGKKIAFVMCTLGTLNISNYSVRIEGTNRLIFDNNSGYDVRNGEWYIFLE